MKFLVMYYALLCCSIRCCPFSDQISKRFIHCFVQLSMRQGLTMELWCQNLMVLSSLWKMVLWLAFFGCCIVIVAFKGQFLMQECCLTSRAFLPCHIEGCQDYEEEWEGPPYCQSTMWVCCNVIKKYLVQFNSRSMSNMCQFVINRWLWWARQASLWRGSCCAP